MTHHCPMQQGPLASCISRRLVSVVLQGLLVVSLLVVSASGVAARSLNPVSTARDKLSTGTTLAVVRAGGTGMYDDIGKLLLDLPMGTAVKVNGRTSDNQWFYGSTRDGATGWVSAAGVLIFGVRNVPEREGFAGPAPTDAAAVDSTAAATTDTGKSDAASAATVSAAQRLQAMVNSGSQRLNVRSGPGTTYPIVTSLASGAQLTASARNAGADWIRVEGTALPGGPGWVSTRFLELEGSAQDLPVAATGAAPAAPASVIPPAAAPSLTGKLVFQESSGGKIDVYDLASGSLRALTIGADPALSPDGRMVAFWRQDGSDYGLYLVGIDGVNERRILRRTEMLRAPAWSPDGSEIVFSHVNGEHRCRDAGYGVCLPDTFPYSVMFPLKITDQWSLARVDGDGGSYQDLAVMEDAISPNWSERGIFYAAAGIQLFQDVVDDSQNQLVLGEFRYQDPAGQPGGERLAFHSLEKDHWEIFTAKADGSNVTALTRPTTTLITPLPHNVAPAWSPDGQHIVFLSNRAGEWKLWVMNPDGSDQRALPVDAPITYNYQAEQVVSWGQ